MSRVLWQARGGRDVDGAARAHDRRLPERLGPLDAVRRARHLERGPAARAGRVPGSHFAAHVLLPEAGPRIGRPRATRPIRFGNLLGLHDARLERARPSRRQSDVLFRAALFRRHGGPPERQAHFITRSARLTLISRCVRAQTSDAESPAQSEDVHYRRSQPE